MDAFVFWRADALARHVRVAPAPDDVAAASLVRFEPDHWGGRQAGRTTLDGYHLILVPAIGVEHHLFFTDADPPPIGTPLLPQPNFDAWHPERLEATLAFWRFAQNPRTSPAPRIKPPRPTAGALELAFLVWVLDLKKQGARDRALARALFGEVSADWEDGGFRSQVRRLLAKARAFADGRYRLLLKPRREARLGGPSAGALKGTAHIPLLNYILRRPPRRKPQAPSIRAHRNARNRTVRWRTSGLLRLSELWPTWIAERLVIITHVASRVASVNGRQPEGRDI